MKTRETTNSNDKKIKKVGRGGLVRRVKDRPYARFISDWWIFVAGIVALMVVAFAIGGVSGQLLERAANQKPKDAVVVIKGDKLFGIDINGTDNGVDYEEVIGETAHLPDFVFIRASVGYKADPIFEGAYACAKGHQRLTGVYFQYDPSANLDAKVFAAYCVGLFGQRRIGKDPVALYLGSGGEEMEDVPPEWVRTWLATFHALTGVKPLIYMSSEVARSQDWTPVLNGGYELWASYYGLDDGENYGVPDGVGQWPCLKIHQFTTRALEDKRVGANVFFGTEDEWYALAQTRPV